MNTFKLRATYYPGVLKNIKNVLTSLIFITAIILPFVVYNLGKVEFNLDLNRFTKILGSILIVSLIVERMIEILVLDPMAAKKNAYKKWIQMADSAVENDQKEIIEGLVGQDKNEAHNKIEIDKATIDKAVNDKAQTDFLNLYIEKSTEIKTLKEQKRRKVIPIALGIGIIISLTGIRVMEELFIVPDNFSIIQKNVFIAVDIILSGTLIGGGSDLVHKIIKLFKLT